MPISGKYFPSQVSGERVFLLIRRHWMIFALMALLVFVLLVPILILIIYWFSNPDTFSGALGNFVIVFGGMYALTVIGLFLYGFVNYYLDVYIVTNKRIVDIQQKGFFRREIAELHLHQVQDVEARVEGFLQTVMHFGNIYIQTAGERENFIFEDVPHPYTLAKEIVELHEAQIESEYEPQTHLGGKEVDDYRPEDYFSPDQTTEVNNDQVISPDKSAEESDDEQSEGGIKYLEESYSPKVGNQIEQEIRKEDASAVAEKPLEELGFGSSDSNSEIKSENKLNELAEGQEVSLDKNDSEL